MEQTKISSETLNAKQQIHHITRWLKQYTKSAKTSNFVVGISGGIDSSVVSALCARTGLKTIAVQLPIRQNKILDNRSSMQASWLLERFPNVVHINMDLTKLFNAFEKQLEPMCKDSEYLDLASANARSRLRMMTLYQIAQCHDALVVGTGNRVEDFGVGFFTKYGDGGVDISPIGDCLKTQVWDIGRELGLHPEIIDAPPTDGLWADGRTDEDQIGMTYPELETAMNFDQQGNDSSTMTSKERANLKKYRQIRSRNMHKMLPIPVCKFL